MAAEMTLKKGGYRASWLEQKPAVGVVDKLNMRMHSTATFNHNLQPQPSTAVNKTQSDCSEQVRTFSALKSSCMPTVTQIRFSKALMHYCS